MVRGERITVNLETCLGCHTCEIACATAHSQSGDLLAAVIAGETPGHRIYVEAFRNTPVPVPCNHCDEAACIMACPTGAAHRKTENGPVLVDGEKCIGCAMCVQACPFGVIALSSTTRKAYKCDVCIERQARNEDPACVAACPTRSLSFSGEREHTKSKREKAAGLMAAAAEKGAQEIEGL